LEVGTFLLVSPANIYTILKKHATAWVTMKKKFYDIYTRSLNIRNGEALEARVKKELEEQGLFDPNDEDGIAVGEAAKENDEILEELVRCQVKMLIFVIKSLDIGQDSSLLNVYSLTVRLNEPVFILGEPTHLNLMYASLP